MHLETSNHHHSFPRVSSLPVTPPPSACLAHGTAIPDGQPVRRGTERQYWALTPEGNAYRSKISSRPPSLKLISAIGLFFILVRVRVGVLRVRMGRLAHCVPRDALRAPCVCWLSVPFRWKNGAGRSNRRSNHQAPLFKCQRDGPYRLANSANVCSL